MKRNLSSTRTALIVLFTEVENFVARTRPFAGDALYLVVAVEMALVGPVADLLTLQQFSRRSARA